MMYTRLKSAGHMHLHVPDCKSLKLQVMFSSATYKCACILLCICTMFVCKHRNQLMIYMYIIFPLNLQNLRINNVYHN